MISGKKIGKMLGLPYLHIQKKNDKCTSCGICTKKCPMSIEVGAELISGTLGRQSDCIVCAACVDSCPQEVMTLTFGRENRK